MSGTHSCFLGRNISFLKSKINFSPKCLGSKHHYTVSVFSGKYTERIVKNHKNKSNFNNLSLITKRNESYLASELKKFYNEYKESHLLNRPQLQIRDPRDTIDMLYTFEKEDQIKNFVVSSDSSSESGYSSASLKITPDKTALFYGYISTTIPKTGNVTRTGFANMMTHRKMKSFGRLSFYDWTSYSHLVIKVRGDGRAYFVILPCEGEYDETQGFQYVHPIYTRGGPYWQLTKIPFSHFCFATKGRFDDTQAVVNLSRIYKIGITLADNNDGPFKLEIDYIGLEKKPTHKVETPYEAYYTGKPHM